MEKSEILNFGGRIVRIRRPIRPGASSVIALIHGLTGDENSMWIFASRLPADAWLIAPRGIYPALPSGYSWYPPSIDKPSLTDFSTAIQYLLDLFTTDLFPQADFSTLDLVGFSQGAALAFAVLLQHPEWVGSVACLSGFLPHGSTEWLAGHALSVKKIFIAHGSQDDRIPVEHARDAAAILENAGAQVTYCEDDVGHKLSASCFRGLEAFFGGKGNC